MATTRSAAVGSVRDPRIGDFVREVETQQHRSHSRPELGDLSIALEEDAHVDCILMDRTEIAEMIDHSHVDFTHPMRMTSEQVVDGDAGYADVCLVDRCEFAVTVRA